MGDFKDHGNILTASIKVFGLEGRYRSIAGLDDRLWVLPDLRGNAQRGPSLPLHYEITLGGQRYDNQSAVSINLDGSRSSDRERFPSCLGHRSVRCLSPLSRSVKRVSSVT